MYSEKPVSALLPVKHAIFRTFLIQFDLPESPCYIKFWEVSGCCPFTCSFFPFRYLVVAIMLSHDTISTKKKFSHRSFSSNKRTDSVLCSAWNFLMTLLYLPQQAPPTRTCWKLQWLGDPPMKKAVQIFWPRFPIPVQWQPRTAQIT